MANSIIILPETDDETLCLAMRGVITKADHSAFMVEPLRERIEKHGFYNLVLVYEDDFEGYQPAAAQQSFNTISDLGPYARRIAFVNPTTRKLFQNNLMRVKLGQEIKNFNRDERAAAISWAKQE